MSPPTHRPAVSMHRARSQSQRLPTRKKKCRREGTKPNLNPYPCPMHPGQWENLKGAGIQLVNRSTNGSAVLESTSPGTSTPRSTPPGTSTPGSKQSGSATLTFSSPHCLPSVDRGGPLWGQDAGERATAWATWPCLLPTATRDSERTSFYCLGQRARSACVWFLFFIFPNFQV